ncbi:MAG: PAS domain-containing protein, partial [Verrucomicrobiales bacterium]
MDAILQAELPQRLSLDLMVTHAAVAERLARGEDREDLLLSFCECLDLALEGWSPMVILDLGNGSIAVGNAHCTKEEAPGLLSVLDQLPDLETIYPVGKLSVESDRWLTACPQRTVKHFGCFRVGKTGLLVFTSNQANRLDQTELTTARLIAEAMAFVADYEAPAASVHRQAPDRIVKSPDPGDLLSQASCRTALSEILQEAVCLLNDTGEVIHVNEAATRMLGVPQDRLIGKPLQPFAVGSESVTFIKGLHTHADTQTHSICLRQEPNNDSIWVDARTQSIEVDGDQPAQTILVLRDKSLEKGLEEQLEDSKEQLKAVTASPSLLMFRVDRRGAVISAEGGFMEQAQLKENDLVGRNAMGFCQDSATRRRLWRQLRRDGEASAGIETEFGFLKVTLAATLGPNRKPHTVHGLAVKSKVSTTEATALPVERIVEKIVEKPIYIEAPAANPPPAPQPLCPSWIGTLHALGDALVMIDAQGVIRFINLAAERMLACQQSEVIGLPFLHLGTFGDTDPLNTFLVEPQPLGAIHQVRLQRHDGVMLEIGLAGAPITDGQNQIQGFVLCCCADQSGEALTDGERQIMERENFKALSTFAGGIAHDLNNILTSLIGNVSLANMLVMDVPEASERLVEAERACFRAKDLSHQLLTFAKGSTPVKKDTGLDDLIQQCAELYLRGAKAVSRIISKPGLWSVNIDEGQISQVLENLILNADHSMPHGGTVTLSSENFHYSAEQGQIKLPLEEGLYVRISVLDEGAGIPEDQLAHIFKP